MDDLVTIEMLVNKAVADEISQKGLAEIALRRADAKFRAMVKARIIDDDISNSETPRRIAEELKKIKAPSDVSLVNVRGAIREFENGLGKLTTLTTTTKNMALQVESICQATGIVQNLSYLNVGLSMANMAVDMIGFVAINTSLNQLNSEVQVVAKGVGKIVNAKKNEKITEFQRLVMRINSESSKIQGGSVIDADKLEELLIDLRAFISEMVRNLRDSVFEKELTLKIIYSLLPAYTQLLNEFTKRYYFQNQCLPANYEMFMGMYNELEDSDYRNELRDYYYLEKKLHSREILDILNAQTLVELNGRVQIEDQTYILQTLLTQEKVEEFDKSLDDLARARAEEYNLG